VKKKTSIRLLIIVLLISQAAYSQPEPPNPVGLPIDGGIFFLIASAVIYGVNKIRNNKI
jgi:hypothetical protein